jgi:hypothetical protein
MNALALLNNTLLVLYYAVVLISVYQIHWAGRLNVFERQKL